MCRRLKSIESVNVATNSMDAEQGQAGGAAINVTIKSGTNDFHGVGFEYNTDSAIQARNVFYNSPTLPKNIQNQYGGTLGGPIVRNKLFFFVGDEQTSRRANVSRLATVPTAAQRAGDFSGLGTTDLRSAHRKSGWLRTHAFRKQYHSGLRARAGSLNN